jgi:antitoxin MazE
MYIMERVVRVSKWGNSLAIRVPSAVVEALDLKEGDEVEVRIAGPRSLEVDRDGSKERALAHIRAARWKLPPGWTFDRDDANSR